MMIEVKIKKPDGEEIVRYVSDFAEIDQYISEDVEISARTIQTMHMRQGRTWA